MKTTITAIIALLLAPVLVSAQTGASPSMPVGTLTTNTNLARVGASPNLNWTITYPQTITQVVTANSDDTFTPKVEVTMRVRMIGADYRYSSTRFKPVQVEVSVNGGSYSRIFSGIHTDVNPSTVILTRTVSAGQTVRFRFRGSQDTGYTNWNPWRYGPDLMVAMMAHGDMPPTYAPYLSPNGVDSYLTPYLAPDGSMQLGPRDLIYLAELTNTSTSASGFDLQDLVMLVTCTETTK